MNRTTIPWADFTWNPTTGCTFGCEWCYARKVAARFGGPTPQDSRAPGYRLAHEGDVFPYGFAPTLYEHRLTEPLRRRKPATIFLGSMGDVFDPAIPDGFRDRIIRAIFAAKQHTFVILTKRAGEMHRYMTDFGPGVDYRDVKPLPNLVLGVSVTNQADADERIPLLLDTPAAMRMVSVEPMLGPVDFGEVWLTDCRECDNFGSEAIVGLNQAGQSLCRDACVKGGSLPHLDFVAVGGKTPGKPLHEQDDVVCGPSPLDALRSLRDQCAEAGVPFHYKAGSHNPPLDGVVYDAPIPRLESVEVTTP